MRYVFGAFIPAFLAILTTGCASPVPGGERPEFGASVRQTIEAQTYRPGERVPPLDGDSAAAAAEAYRTDVGRRDSIGRRMMGTERE